MAQENIRYPIDKQTFSTVRNGNYVYVDKTEYVYNMTHSDMTYVFLSRPRRFGKSLLVSTLKSYFEGEKDLFKGLAIEKLEREWKNYPVIHLDMSDGKGRDEAVQRIKTMYDGYHFTWPSPDIYNPYSLVNAFSDGELNSYWFGSGTPTYLIEALRRYKVEPDKIGGRQAASSDFDAPTERLNNITPLLYQSWYVTITDYDEGSELYTLDIPNKEVRTGLMRNLVQFYVPGRMVEETNVLIAKFYFALRKGEIDEAMKMLQEYLRTIPYTDNSDSEGSWQRLLYVIFDIGGKDIEPEVELHTADGRIDLTVKTNDVIYIMELKLGKSAEAAMRQIEEKDYAARFALDSRPKVKVGISFDNSVHTISDWIIK